MADFLRSTDVGISIEGKGSKESETLFARSSCLPLVAVSAPRSGIHVSKVRVLIFCTSQGRQASTNQQPATTLLTNYHHNKTHQTRRSSMQHTDSTLLRFETLALFVCSLAFGMLLLRIRDFLFGEDVDGGSYHHIDFKKKIEEEEQANLDEIIKDRGCRNLDADLMQLYQNEERQHHQQ